MENQKNILKSTADGKGGVYITKMEVNGNITIYYCVSGRWKQIKNQRDKGYGDDTI